MELRGRTAIVTGAGSGIGRELALEFARADANVVCCGRTESSLHETVALIENHGGVGAVADRMVLIRAVRARDVQKQHS
jgi:NAD(P)-dependent dehydrogenase (short-subunit alcohol dehydrogenase family)